MTKGLVLGCMYLFTLLLLLSGCASSKEFHLVTPSNYPSVLYPPGTDPKPFAHPAPELKFDVTISRAPTQFCNESVVGPGMRISPSNANGTTWRITLDRRPQKAGALIEWVRLSTAQYKCFSTELALQIVQAAANHVSVSPERNADPLRVNSDRSGYEQLYAGDYLRVVTPLVKDRTSSDKSFVQENPLSQTVDSSGAVTLILKASPNLVGYDDSIYQLSSTEPFFKLIARSTNRFVDAVEGSVTEPFVPKSWKGVFAWRLHYINSTDQRTFRAIVLAAETLEQLDGASAAVVRTGKCIEPSAAFKSVCELVPQGVAFNRYLRIYVDGQQKFVPADSTVGDVIGEYS